MRASPLSIVTATVTMIGAVTFLIANGLSGAINQADALTLLAAFAGFGLVGAVILRGQPRHRVGWLFVAIMGFGLTNGFAAIVFEVTKEPLAGAINDVTWWPVGTFALVFLPLWFPTGRPPTKRWRWVAWLALISLLGIMTVDLVREEVCVEQAQVTTDTVMESDCLETVVNPIGVPGVVGAEDGPPGEFLLLGLLMSILAAMASLAVRFRRSSGIERMQLKWIVSAVGLVVGWAVIGDVLFIDVLRQEDVLFGDLIGSVIFGIGLTAIPVAAGVAITRYHLYDIDRIISKAVVYGGLLIFIAVVFGAVVFLPLAIVGTGESNSSGDLLWPLLATVILVLVLQPVRSRLQKGANRLVYGKRATPYEALTDFSATVAGNLATEELLVRMAEILAEGTGAESASVWVVSDDLLHLAASYGLDPDQPKPALPMVEGAQPEITDADDIAPVIHQGELLGALSIKKPPGEAVRPIEQKLTADLASQAGVVLRNFRLTDELLDRLDDLQASRVRLVKAQDEERRRLERNLHDGAQQQLVALKIKLSILGRVDDADKRAELVAGLVSITDEAIDSLRDLARGIYPPTLAQEGLAAALRAQAAKAAVTVVVEAENIGRYTPEVEAAVYYCTLEALQNIAKYAQATEARVLLTERDNVVRFEIADDGVGFDPAEIKRGAGLENMEDRLGAFGGTVDIMSTPGQGTTVRGEVPATSNEPAAPLATADNALEPPVGNPEVVVPVGD